MGEFCNKCSVDMGFPKPDIDIPEIVKSLPIEEGHYLPVICEGCGMLAIGVFDGRIECAYSIGNELVEWKPYEE